MTFRIVGAVGIKVRPDTENFREETRAKLKGETKGLKASVAIEPDDRKLEIKAKLAVAELNQKIHASNISVKIPLKLDTERVLGEASKAAEQITRRLRSADTSVEAELKTDQFDRELNRLVARSRTAGRSIKEQLEDVRADITARIEANKEDILRAEAQIKALGDQELDLSVDLSPEDMAANRAKIEAFRQEIEAKKVEIGVDVDRFRDATRALGDMASRAQQIRNTDATPRINRDAFDSDLNHIIQRAQTEVESVKQALKRIRGEIDARINVNQSELTRIRREIESLQTELRLNPGMETPDKLRLLADIEALKKQAEARSIELDVDVDRRGRAEASLRELTRSRRAELTITMAQRTRDDIMKTLDAITGAQTFKDTVRFFENMAVNADKVALAAVAGISGIAAFAGTLTHLTGGLTTFIGQLGQIGGLAASVPALFVGWKVISSTFSLIFDTMGSALKGNAKALARFSETAQGYILEFKEAYDDLRHTVQDEFYNNIGPTVLRTLDRTFPIIKQGFADVARTGALLIRNAFFTLDELGRKGTIKKFFDNLNLGLQEAGPGLDHAVDAFATLTDFGGRQFPEIGRLFSNMATQFDLFVGRAEAQNKLAVWFETAKVRAEQLYDGLKDFVGTFQAISDAAHRAGYDGLASFQDIMSRIRDTVTGPVFQNTMTTLFEGARLGAQKFFEQVKPLNSMLTDLAPTISQGFIDVADGIGSLVGDIARSFSDSPFFKQGLGDLFKGFRDGLKALGDYLPTITDGLGSLGTILGDMFRGFTPIFGGTVAAVASAFTAMQPSLSGLAPDMASVAQSVVDILAAAVNMGTGPLGLLIDFFVALPQPMQQIIVFAKPLLSFFSAGLPLVRDFASKIATFLGAGPGSLGAIKLAAGVGFGVAVGGLLWFLQKSGEDARKAQAQVRKLQEDAERLARMKIENPLTPVGQQADAMQEANDQAAVLQSQWENIQKGIQNSYGSLEEFKGAFPGIANPELLFGGKLDRQGLVDTFLGTDGPSKQATLNSLADIRNGLAQLEGPDAARWLQDTFGSDQAQLMHEFGGEIDRFRDTSNQAAKSYDENMSTIEGRTKNVMGYASDLVRDFGKITLDTVPKVIPKIDSLASSFDSFGAMAQIMATTLGGVSGEIDANADRFAGALRKYGDSPREMSRFLTEMGLNKQETEKIFTGLGYSAEEFEAAFKYSLGSVSDVYRNTGSALADNVPLFRAGSDGITELSRELSTRTNIDASFLAGMLRDTGLRAEDLGEKMAKAGTPIGVIKDVLGQMGYPAQVAQDAIGKAAQAAQDLTSEGTWSTYAVLGFQTELGKVAEAGDDATAKADALRNAIDRLNGSPISTDRIKASFDAAVDSAKKIFEVGEGEPAKNWASIVDQATGQIDTMTQQGRDLQSQTDALSREAWALASDTFNRVYQQTGDIDKATQAAQGSIESQVQGFRDVAAAAGIPQPAIDELLKRYQLIPSQVATDVRVNAIDAETGLQSVVGLLGQMKAGATANIGVIDIDAKKKLEDLGVKLTAVGDGTYTATLDADPTKAKQQVDQFTKFASTQVPVVQVDANMQPMIDAVQSTIDMVIRQANPFISVSADTNPVVTQVQDIGRYILGYETVMPVGANTNPAIMAGQAAVDQMNRLQATIQVKANVSSALSVLDKINVFRSANGNLWDGAANLMAFANGGFNFPRRPRQLPLTYPEVHRAHITKTLRVFGEPETGGEAYIPLSSAKRARSTAILNEVADRFGYELNARKDIEQFADGGVVGGPSSPLSGANGATVNIYYPVAEKTSVANARAGQMIGAIGD